MFKLNLVLKYARKVLLFCLVALLSITLIISLSLPFSESNRANNTIPVASEKLLVIDNVNLVTVTDEGVLENRQLIIADGKISDIVAAGSQIDANATYVDAQNGYLTPGLFDMHVHLYDASYLVANLAYGVTTVRALRGDKHILSWRNQLRNNEWLGSNLYVSSPILDGQFAHALNQKTLSPEEGRYQVRLAKTQGYDLIKAYGYLQKDVFEAIVDEAKNLDIPVAKHGPHPIGNASWESIAELQSLEHVEDIFQGPLNYKFDEGKLESIIPQIKTLNVPITPTLVTFNHLTQLSVYKQDFVNDIDLKNLNTFHRLLMQKYSVNRWLTASEKHAAYNQKEFAFLQTIVKQLHKHGVTLLVGSDAGTMYTLPGISTHDEMALMKQSGMSDLAVLEAATINAAKALKVDHQYATIEVGKVADLILVAENPLQDIRLLKKPTLVIKQGQLLKQQALLELKELAQEHQGFYWSFIRFLDDILDRAFQ